jgi:hypothetical protein
MLFENLSLLGPNPENKSLIMISKKSTKNENGLGRY